MPYADLEDLGSLGIAAAALEAITDETKLDALAASGELVDSYLRARYALPSDQPGWLVFASWGRDIRRANALLAVYDLMVLRGYAPESEGDEQLRLRYDDTIRWLEGVASQKIHPNVTPKQHQSAGYDAPRLLSNLPRGYEVLP